VASDVTADKRDLRDLMRRQRAQHGVHEHDMACARAWDVIATRPHDVIAVYDAFPHELDVAALRTRATANGKIVAVPVVDGGVWRFSVDIDAIDVFVVPGRAFDDDGNRLGTGKGIYDRLLQRRKTSALLLGICHTAQRVAQVPHDVHDVPMDVVVDAVRATWGLRARENLETTTHELSSRR
jgi:5-formyltetrahydrofolate cyclo-ligase